MGEAIRQTTGGQYLTFRLGEEQYGVEILNVQEIKGDTTITPLPNMPGYLKGVMNLRGQVIPVLDLRARFGTGEVPRNQFTVIIVVTVGDRIAGLMVDAVSDVIDLAAEAVQPRPDLGSGIDARFVMGIGQAGDRLVVLLDLDRVVLDVEAVAA